MERKSRYSLNDFVNRLDALSCNKYFSVTSYAVNGHIINIG
jgi:hypothetical protein